MTTVATRASSVRLSGAVCFVASLLGALSGVFLAVVPAQVSQARWSYPLDETGYAAIQVFFAIQHLGLLAGLAVLAAAGAVPPTRLARGAWTTAVLGMVLLTLTEAWAVSAGDEPVEGAVADQLGSAYGVATLLLGVGLVVLGVSSARARAWAGWPRYLVLALGAWVFVPLLPALFAPNFVGRLAITGWMLLFAALGAVLLRAPSDAS